jgi:hypothetical protein
VHDPSIADFGRLSASGGHELTTESRHQGIAKPRTGAWPATASGG